MASAEWNGLFNGLTKDTLEKEIADKYSDNPHMAEFSRSIWGFEGVRCKKCGKHWI